MPLATRWARLSLGFGSDVVVVGEELEVVEDVDGAVWCEGGNERPWRLISGMTKALQSARIVLCAKLRISFRTVSQC